MEKERPKSRRYGTQMEINRFSRRIKASGYSVNVAGLPVASVKAQFIENECEDK
jgi:hypothetical protein